MCSPDIFAFQGYISAIIQVQISKGDFSQDTVRIFFVVSLFQACISVLILFNMNLLCYKLLLLKQKQTIPEQEKWTAVRANNSKQWTRQDVGLQKAPKSYLGSHRTEILIVQSALNK